MVRIVGSRALGIVPHHTVGSSTRIGVCPVVIGAPTVRPCRTETWLEKGHLQRCVEERPGLFSTGEFQILKCRKLNAWGLRS